MAKLQSGPLGRKFRPRMAQLKSDGAPRLCAIRFCPHAADSTGPKRVIRCHGEMDGGRGRLALGDEVE